MIVIKPPPIKAQSIQNDNCQTLARYCNIISVCVQLTNHNFRQHWGRMQKLWKLLQQIFLLLAQTQHVKSVAETDDNENQLKSVGTNESRNKCNKQTQPITTLQSDSARKTVSTQFPCLRFRCASFG